MANKYFTQLTQLSYGSVASGDALAIEDISAGETKYISMSELSQYLSGIGAGVSSQFWLSGAGGWPSTTAGCAYTATTEGTSNKVNYKTLDFDKDTQEHAEWSFAMPGDYGGGSITAKFYWTAAGTSTNSVVWGLQGICIADDEAIDQAWGTAGTISDANKSTSADLNISATTSAITLAGTPAGGEMVQWRAYRKAADASDDLALDAKLIGIQITYTRA